MYDIGVAYYPEQWPEERQNKDIQLMKDAGISFVRMGEFAWHKMEPQKGLFDFTWLKDTISLLARNKIDVILCSPTATYPSWMHKAYPDIHQVASDGRTKEFGQRQDACRNHPEYRAGALAITREMSRALGMLPSVTAWQIDNELGNHDSVFCYCGYCEQAFRKWLKEKYSDIDEMNKCWGAEVWSQVYNDFDEVSLPRDTGDNVRGRGQNPGLVLDYKRFSSDSILSFQNELVGIIRQNSPGRQITHNFMKDFTDIDSFAMARELDVVSWNNYPFYELQEKEAIPSSFAGHFMYGLKQQNFWIMEQAAGSGGFEVSTPNYGPGVTRLWAWQTVLCGAARVCFFRWRTARFGTEQYWHGILPHHGMPERCYLEIQDFSRELALMKDFLKNTHLISEIAILYDPDSLWSIAHQPQAEKGFEYHELCRRFSDSVRLTGSTPEIISIDCDFTHYSVLILPSQHIADQQLAERLKDFVYNGGTLILGPRSGVKDHSNAVTEDVLPGVFRSLCGVKVLEYDAVGSRKIGNVTVSGSGLSQVDVTGMADILQLDDDAIPLLTWEGAWYEGYAAASHRLYGSGYCYYLGAVLDSEDLSFLLMAWGILDSSGNKLPEGVENFTRKKDGVVLKAYLNHTRTEFVLAMDLKGIDLLTGLTVESELKLPSFGVALILVD